MLYALVRWADRFSFLHRMTRRLVAILLVAALGVGTLTWAATTYVPACAPHATPCQKAPH